MCCKDDMCQYAKDIGLEKYRCVDCVYTKYCKPTLKDKVIKVLKRIFK